MKTILNVINVYFSVPYFFGDQFLYLKDLGYNIHLICSPSAYLEEYANKQQIHYEAIPITRKITPLTDIVSLIKICKYIRLNKIEIIVGHTAKGGLLAGLAGRIMHVPTIIFFRHGSPIDRNTGVSRFILLWINRFMAACATKIVCVSPSIAELSMKLHLNSANKQVLLGRGTCGGIDTTKKFNPDFVKHEDTITLRAKLNITDDALVVGYCGRLVKDKGIPELVEGFELVCSLHPEKNIYLLLVGPFEVESTKERDALSKKTRNRIITNKKIIYTGYIKDNIELYYSLMSIYILPSYHEGFGMSVLEASSMRIPVLTTKSVGCIDSIIEGETGFYVEISPEAIAKGIELYFNPDLRKKIGFSGRNMVVKYFDHNILWPEIDKLYSQT